MTSIEQLLDAAKASSGSDYKTAKLLGLTPARVSDWRAGRVNPQPEDYALVAAIAGQDAEEALVRAVLEKHKNTPKGERLVSALGKALSAAHAAVAAFVCASLGFLAPAPSEAAQVPMLDNVYYVKLRMHPATSQERRARNAAPSPPGPTASPAVPRCR